MSGKTHLSFDDYAILNASCHAYHAGFGYYDKDVVLDEPNVLSLFADHFSWINRFENEYGDENEYEEVTYTFNCAEAERYAKNYIIDP